MALRPLSYLIRLARRRVLIAAVVAATGLTGVAASAASAYMFRPGDPLFLSGNECTGGYVIRGLSGQFVLTAGHCGEQGATVSGTQRPFGWVFSSKCRPAWYCSGSKTYGGERDTEIVAEGPGDGAYQTVRDPVTGRLPGGTGRVVNWVPNVWLVNGVVVGKVGVRTGWTEGRILYRSPWHNMTSYCTNMRVNHGDSGSPVWVAAPGGGVYAIGIAVSMTSEGGGCFLSIEDLQNVWGGYLPMWATAKKASSGALPPVAHMRAGPQPPLLRAKERELHAL